VADSGIDPREWIELFLVHLRDERRLSPHTVAAYARDLARLSEFLRATGPLDWRTVSPSQLRDEGRVRRGYLGIGVNEITPEAADAFGLSSTDGALVMNVQPGLPADKAGLRNGDIIVGADDVTITTTRELIDYVSSKGPDTTVQLEILRDGERQQIAVKLAERPVEGDEPAGEDSDAEPGIEWLGIRYQDLTPGLRSMHGLPEDLEGVWVTELSPRSPLYDEGLRAGQMINVITEVNGQAVDGVEAFEEIAAAAPSGSRLRIYVRRFFRGQERQPVYVFPAVP